jgi:hypothetical protein
MHSSNLFPGAWVPRDNEKPRQFFEKGCGLGSQPACDRLKQLQ